ncbi:hypothetical protein [Desulfobulbus elongatus]|uniref:hypothetical protein n=1 Tax=Desulfobulbus elongatus TaxID=53332 RepID=UPI000486DBAC|nr:hypothetical protein [Desulfobulbus elongatus]
MAFTCRTDEHHEQILKRICEKQRITKQKALLHIVERFEEVCEARDRNARRVADLEAELSRLKKAVALKIEADKKLFNCLQKTGE